MLWSHLRILALTENYAQLRMKSITSRNLSVGNPSKKVTKRNHALNFRHVFRTAPWGQKMRIKTFMLHETFTTDFP